MKIFSNNNYTLLIFFSNLIFITLYIIISYYNRLAHDDYHSIYMVSEYGIIESIIHEYNHWCTRYFPLLISFSIASMSHVAGVLIIYQLILLLLITGSVLLLFKSILKWTFSSIELTWYQLMNYSLFIVSAIFYCTFNIGETWFWLSSNCTYFLSATATLSGIAMIINQKNTFITYLILIASWLFIGGSNGTLSIFLLLLMSILSFFILIKNNQFINDHFTIRKLFLSSSILLTAFIFLYMGPGNEVRSTSFGSISIFDSIIYNFKFCGMIVLQKIPKVLLYLIIFSIPFYWTGAQRKLNKSNRLVAIMVYATLLLGLAIYIFQLPITYKTQDISADRTIFPVCIMIYFYFCYLFYHIGNKRIIKLKNIDHILLGTSLMGILVINCITLWQQYPIVKQYAAAYDQRIEIIKKTAEKQLIVVPPLPNSGFIYSNEISEEPSHFTNQHLKNGLAIEAEIKVEKLQ